MYNQRETQDHLYSTHRDTYKALPRPPFGKSDHNSILLIPTYKQKLKQEVPVTRSIGKWSDDVDAKLQDCFASTDWNMFRDSYNGSEEYTTSVTGFISKFIDDFVPIVTVRAYPNQKPWLLATSTLSERGEEWDTNSDAYKKSHHALKGSDTHRMWQGSQTITDYKGKPSRELLSDVSLVYQTS
jgi:hypothetical protein